MASAGSFNGFPSGESIGAEPAGGGPEQGLQEFDGDLWSDESIDADLNAMLEASMEPAASEPVSSSSGESTAAPGE